MSHETSSAALAWLLTYAIHSTALLGLAWGITRTWRLQPAASELLWKTALFGGIVTASVQRRLDVQPSGSIVLASTSAAAPAAPEITPGRTERKERKQDASIRQRNEALAATQGTLPAIPYRTLAVMGWALIAFLLAVRYAARRLILVGRLGDRQPLIDGALPAMLDSLRLEVGYRAPVRLTTSTTISSPVALGSREICVPDAALSDLDPEQQRSMLAHELAHLARRDPLWLDTVSVLERIFFFQPLNRMARHHITTASEFLCDEWAVRKTGSSIPLAKCLAKVAEWIQASPLGVPVAGMAEERSLLVSRIARIIESPPSGSRRAHRAALATAVVVIAGTIVLAPGVSGRSVFRTENGGALDDAANHSQTTTTQKTETSTSISTSTSSNRNSTVSSHNMSTTQGQAEDTAVVRALIARLKDEDAQVRRAAAHSLGRLKDPLAVPGLIDVLKDNNAEVRAAAADALGEFEDPRTIAPLLALLEDSSSDVKHNALSALSNFEQGIPAGPVIRALDDSDPDVRHEAAHLLGDTHDRSAVPALSKLLHDASPEVRGAAIQSLGQLGDQSALAAIVGALGDGEAENRKYALEALDELKAGVPESTLLNLMRDTNPDVRAKAAELAGDRRLIGTIPSLRRMLEDQDADVRETAVDALSNIADQAARDALRDALKSADAKIRRRAAEALGERQK